MKAPGQKRLARIHDAVDFERVLRMRPRAISTHFALHHLAAMSVGADRARNGSSESELSTGVCLSGVLPVEDFDGEGRFRAGASNEVCLPPPVGLGLVVPKRHARRAVTRTLLKRQMRAAVLARVERLSTGLWVVRLRAPFERRTYPSAASAALRQAVRSELDELMSRVDDAADRPARRVS